MESCEEIKRENNVLRKMFDGHLTSMAKMQKTLDANGKKLDKINGTVRRHKFQHFPDIFKRIRTLEDMDKLEEGIEIGKGSMSKTTKTIVGVVSAVLTCFVIGSSVFWTVQTKLNRSVVDQMNTSLDNRYGGTDVLKGLKAIVDRVECLEKRRDK